MNALIAIGTILALLWGHYTAARRVDRALINEQRLLLEVQTELIGLLYRANDEAVAQVTKERLERLAPSRN
jgi:hypothetical protein